MIEGKKKKNSRAKGSNTENYLAKRIREHFLVGIDSKVAYQMVHRTPMSGGHVERGDLIIKPPVLKLFPWFIECRNREMWDWKQIWERGENSTILKWFWLDAAEKCHPYDQNIRYQRMPLLVFTRNQQRMYFAAWEDDLFTRGIVPEDFDPVMSVVMTMPSTIPDVDNHLGKKYVVIGDFERLLTLHPAEETRQMQREIDKYLGVSNEHGENPDSS